MRRYLTDLVAEDLTEKIVFLGGPRQVGKTTLSLAFLPEPTQKSPNYLNYDTPAAQKKILRGELPPEKGVVVFDEIHKYRRWRNLIKGFYDTHRDDYQFIVTGSARLDYYSKGGDSMHGRYHYYRLHPFSYSELEALGQKADVASLLKFGGFPEPLFKSSERFWRRWQNERVRRVLHDDLRDLENVKEISQMDLLVELLPDRVGSPLSVENLRVDVGSSRDSVERWLSILENLYLIYRIMPYSANKIRAVKKEKKLYFWDWSQSPEGGARFENMVASHLLKFCHFKEDSEGYKMELRYIRDTDKREVDFVVLQGNKPLFAVECKSGEKKLSPHIRYFAERTPIREFYQVHLGKADFGLAHRGGRVIPFGKFCTHLKLV
jgi:predicted AAA+ superfamily ATPase